MPPVNIATPASGAERLAWKATLTVLLLALAFMVTLWN